jgi:methionyl-tRNA formyltransferase
MSKKRINTIFIGTPKYSVPSLLGLINSDLFNVIAVITQPDKKVGRKQEFIYPPIKKLALKNNIQVFQPEKIKDFSSEIKNLSPDLIVVIAYAQIISEEILNIPQYGCINVHGSLLPKYRGASCVQAALLNDDRETGVTIMKMNKGLDTGPIIAQLKLKIESNDTANTLFPKLSRLSGNFLIPTLEKFIKGDIDAKEQDNSRASYVGLLKKSDGKINWNQDATKIFSHYKAMAPWPGAFTEVDIDNRKKMLKILDIENIVNINKYKTGEIFIKDKKLAVQCATDAVVINTIQLEGKQLVSSEDFLRGNSDFVGKILQ